MMLRRGGEQKPSLTQQQLLTHLALRAARYPSHQKDEQTQA